MSSRPPGIGLVAEDGQILGSHFELKFHYISLKVMFHKGEGGGGGGGGGSLKHPNDL